MQIKKVDWINRPEKVKVSAHSLTFMDNYPSYALYTIGKDDDLFLSYEGEGVSFILLHTDRDMITLNEDEIDISFAGLNAKVRKKRGKSLCIRKRGEEVTFSDEDGDFLSLSYPSFSSSVSAGFKTKGIKREIRLSFFQEKPGDGNIYENC